MGAKAEASPVPHVLAWHGAMWQTGRMFIRISRRAGLWRRTHVVRRALAVAVVAGVALLVRMASQGFPERWVAWLSHALSTESYLVDLEDVAFGFRRGLTVGRGRMSPADPAEPPMLLLENAALEFRWHWGMPSLDWVRGIDVRHLTLASLPRRRGGRRAALPAFDSVTVRCGEADILGTVFRNVGAVVTSAGEQLEIERIRCDLSPPRFPAEVMHGEFTFGVTDGTVQGAANGDMNPVRLVPLLHACGLSSLPAILERFEFPAAPASVRIRVDYAPSAAQRRLEAAISAEACLYRTVPLMSARAAITAEGQQEWDLVRIDQLTLDRPEGTARGMLLFDLRRHGMEFTANSTFDPKHLAGIIGLFHDASWDPWKFGTPTEIAAKGYVAFDGSEQSTTLDGRARAPSLQYKNFRARSVDAEFAVSPGRCTIGKLTASAYGGTLEARSEFEWFPDAPSRFSTALELQKSRLGPVLAALTGRDPGEPGTLDLGLEVAGNLSTNTLRTLHGTGKVQVREAHLYRMPLFAGFTDFMARNVPGLDFVLSQNDVNAAFAIQDYGLQFSKLQVEGSVFSIQGQGAYWFSDTLDIGVRINLLKQRTWLGRVLKVALFPVSKLFELELTGTLATPKWSPTTLALRSRRKATQEQRGLAPDPIPAGEGAAP